MENNIKKVFVKNDADEKYLVVVRENGKKVYHDEEVQKAYDEVIEELLLSHDLEEKDYTKLFDMGIIQEVEEDLISEIVYYDDDSKFIEKYYSGDEKEYLKEKLYDEEEFDSLYDQKIAMLCEQYNLSEEELENLGIVSIKNSKKNLSEVVSTLKIKNLKLTKRIVAYTLAGAILLVGGYGIVKHVQKNKETKNKNQQQYNYEDDNYINNNKVPDTPVVEEMDEFVNIETTPVVQEVEHISEVHQDPTSRDELITMYANDNKIGLIHVSKDTVSPRETLGEEYIDTNGLIAISGSDMENLSNHLQNNENELNDYTHLIYYEKYALQPEDKAFIKYFANYERQILYSAYIDNNLDLAKEYINYANYDTVSCIRDGNPIQAEINGELKEIYFNELSSFGKQMVLEIAWNLYRPMDYTLNYGQEIISKMDFPQIITNPYNEVLEEIESYKAR